MSASGHPIFGIADALQFVLVGRSAPIAQFLCYLRGRQLPLAQLFRHRGTALGAAVAATIAVRPR